MLKAAAPEYLFDAGDKPSLPLHDVPLVEATEESVDGFGRLIDDPNDCEIEIVRWPAQGWRPVDDGTGDEGGTVEGTFSAHWQGDVLLGRNEAVDGDYVLGWSRDPQQASAERATVERRRVLLWHLNYHPDGGQLFFPLDDAPFVVPVALPGDDLKPNDVVALWCGGGRVHARVSCDVGQEFGVYLAVPLVRG